jgi:tetratricopeptide (TPR) repeat protein
VLVQLEITGTDQVRKKNNKFVDFSIQYGSKAIELLEANKKPANMNDKAWTYYQGLLPSLYNSMGILKLASGNIADAKASFIKATKLAPVDPFNYLILGGILNDEYKSEAKKYQEMPDGPARDAARNKVMEAIDAVIDAYAHMIALSEGNATLQQMRQEYLQDLESYYKFRHNNSTAGMQQLIDKYKTPPK